MTTQTEALKLALEYGSFPQGSGVIRAIKEALAQEQEQFCDANCVWTDHHPDCKLAQPKKEAVAWEQLHEHIAGPFYTHPPQRTWVDLTDEDISKISQRLGIDHDDSWTDLKQAIEAKLKQKNGFAEEKNS